MRSTRLRMVAVCAGLLAAAVAAQAGAAPAAKAKAEPAAASAAAVSTARGVVRSVGDGRLVLEPKEPAGAAPVVLALDTSTVVQRLGKTLTVKDLKPGDAVTASYVMRDGKAVAQRVWVRTGATAGGAASRNGGKSVGR